MNMVLQRLMDENNLNQRQLAERVGMKRETITSYVNGKWFPKVDFWIRAQTVFHIPDEYMWAVIKKSYRTTKEYHGGDVE